MVNSIVKEVKEKLPEATPDVARETNGVQKKFLVFHQSVPLWVLKKNQFEIRVCFFIYIGSSPVGIVICLYWVQVGMKMMTQYSLRNIHVAS